jgi:hypothetical protein
MIFSISVLVSSLDPYKSSGYRLELMNKERYFNIRGDKYRLLHGLFHIGQGIIPRLPYQLKAIAG